MKFYASPENFFHEVLRFSRKLFLWSFTLLQKTFSMKFYASPENAFYEVLRFSKKTFLWSFTFLLKTFSMKCYAPLENFYEVLRFSRKYFLGSFHLTWMIKILGWQHKNSKKVSKEKIYIYKETCSVLVKNFPSAAHIEVGWRGGYGLVGGSSSLGPAFVYSRSHLALSKTFFNSLLFTFCQSLSLKHTDCHVSLSLSLSLSLSPSLRLSVSPSLRLSGSPALCLFASCV